MLVMDLRRNDLNRYDYELWAFLEFFDEVGGWDEMSSLRADEFVAFGVGSAARDYEMNFIITQLSYVY